MREVAPDVTTNALHDPRLFLIVMDDVLVPFAPGTMGFQFPELVTGDW